MRGALPDCATYSEDKQAIDMRSAHSDRKRAIVGGFKRNEVLVLAD